MRDVAFSCDDNGAKFLRVTVWSLLKSQFFNPGHAGEVVGGYILDALIARRKSKC